MNGQTKFMKKSREKSPFSMLLITKENTKYNNLTITNYKRLTLRPRGLSIKKYCEFEIAVVLDVVSDIGPNII